MVDDPSEDLRLQWRRCGAMSEVLDEARREAQAAKAEAAYLRAELAESRAAAGKLQEAGADLQEAYGTLWCELSQAVGDVAYWQTLAETNAAKHGIVPDPTRARASTGVAAASRTEHLRRLRDAAQEKVTEAARTEAAQWRRLAERRGDELRRRPLLGRAEVQPQTVAQTSRASCSPERSADRSNSHLKSAPERTTNPMLLPTPCRAGARSRPSSAAAQPIATGNGSALQSSSRAPCQAECSGEMMASSSRGRNSSAAGDVGRSRVPSSSSMDTLYFSIASPHKHRRSATASGVGPGTDLAPVRVLDFHAAVSAPRLSPRTRSSSADKKASSSGVVPVVHWKP